MTTRMRVSHFLVQPVLVYDDGEELTPGPETVPASLSGSQVSEFVARLIAEAAAWQSDLT